ncbi:MAG: imidazolonepropionase [Bacteroidetes bacterium]|nr:MAG: imidazolonepropionase [Bacteroidota bacterium]
MTKLFINIKELVQVRTEPISFVAGENMKILPSISNAFLLVENGRISDFGEMKDCPKISVIDIVDASGRIVMPSYCDSHTHLVYAGNREGEFVDKINGLSYEEIANRGGGILNSAKLIATTSEDDLFEQSKARLLEIIEQGTGAVEIKSGYGLSFDSELKMLRVIKRLQQDSNIEIKATFLGAHAIPANYKDNKQGYLRMLIDELMPVIAKEKLAEYVDIFCEKGYFSVDDTELILEAGQKYGLIPKIHVNQFNAIGGVEAGIKYNALSLDHLEVLGEGDIDAMKTSKAMPVALPSCSYFLSISYTPAREIMKAGLPIALASDYNPGSTPSGNMSFVIATACIKMKMTPEEAINAATLNGAYAMGLEKELGSITVGKLANLIVTKPINSYSSLAYYFATNNIESVYLKGEKQ